MSIEPAATAFCAMKRTMHYSRPLVAVVFLALLVLPALVFAQERGGRGPKPSGEPPPAPRAQGNPGQRPGQQPGLQGGIFQRLRELPPGQQRHFMETNPRFQRLPPERQELIRERLRQWNSLTPLQKEKVREREEILQGLSPAQRQQARMIWPQWQELTPPRRQAIMEGFRHLRDLPPDQRESYLNSQEVRERFSPHERNILDGLNKLLPAARPAEANGPDL